jgi:ferredoxin-thioredoxin reductase catalytic subunit/glutaredoxin
MPFTPVDGEDRGDVRVFSMSTCAWCDKMKQLLSNHNVQYHYMDLDRVEKEERDDTAGYLDSIYPEWGFPCLLFDSRILIIGYQEKEIREALSLPATGGEPDDIPVPPAGKKVEMIMERLQRFAEKKDASLNPDRAVTVKLVNGLLENQERYGYWACPCMLATGKREEDRDIICPCHYWEADAAEFGACFCGLFVSQKVISGEKAMQKVPERRKKLKK